MEVEDGLLQVSRGDVDAGSPQPLQPDTSEREIKKVSLPEGKEVEIDPHIWVLMHILDLVEPSKEPDIPEDTSDTGNDRVDINELMRFAGVDVDEIEVRSILSGMGFSTLRELSVIDPQSPATMNQLEVQHIRNQDVYKRPQNWGEIKKTALNKVITHLQEKGLMQKDTSHADSIRVIRELARRQFMEDMEEEGVDFLL